MAGPYVTTRARRLLSVVLGGILGGLLTAVSFVALVQVLGEDVLVDFDLLAQVVGVGALLGTIAWIFGIAFFGFPIWALLERRLKRTSWRLAFVCGGASSPILFLIVWAVLLIVSAMMAGKPLTSI